MLHDHSHIENIWSYPLLSTLCRKWCVSLCIHFCLCGRKHCIPSCFILLTVLSTVSKGNSVKNIERKHIVCLRFFLLFLYWRKSCDMLCNHSHRENLRDYIVFFLERKIWVCCYPIEEKHTPRFSLPYWRKSGV